MLRNPLFPHTRRPRLLSVFVLLALLFGQGVSTLHIATSRHGVCAANGEAIERQDEASAEAGQHGREDAPSHGAHHECVVLHAWSIVGTPAFSTGPSTIVLDAPAEQLPSLLASQPAGIALLRVAPKNSPPNA